MLTLIVIALLIAVAIGLVCIFLGRVIKTLQAPIAVAVGGSLEQWGWVIGVVVGLLWFVTGGHIGKIF